MRLAVISDTNTAESFEKIYSYFKSFSIKYKVDGVVVNGDILGIFNAKDEKNKPLEDFSKVFQNAAPYTSGKLIEAIQKIKQGQELDQKSLIELSESLKDYIDERYMFVIHSLRKLSQICKVYFNLGNHESPLHDYMLHELSLVFGLEKEMLNKILYQSKERNHFEIFKNKLKEINNFKLISQKAILEKDILIAGIPGLYDDDLDQEKSISQENITKSTLNEVSKKMVKARAILIFNHIENKTNSKPFLLEPKSNLMKEFLKKKSNIPKLFCQSNDTFKTTHFYIHNEWYYLLNNAGINNGLFNVIDITNEIICYDIDPTLDQITRLKTYTLEKVVYNDPISRLKLNYLNAELIVHQRKLDNSMHNL